MFRACSLPRRRRARTRDEYSIARREGRTHRGGRGEINRRDRREIHRSGHSGQKREEKMSSPFGMLSSTAPRAEVPRVIPVGDVPWKGNIPSQPGITRLGGRRCGGGGCRGG